MIRPFILSFLFLLCACATPPDIDASRWQRLDSDEPAQHAAILRQASTDVAGRAFVEGNNVKLLRDGNMTYPAMLAAIKHARHDIEMESFTFDDKAGKKFADALIARHRHGVRVSLLYDAWGSSDTPPGIFDYMRENGIELLENNPVDVLSIADGGVNQRDHRKLLIVDGREAFVGGVNISVVYLKKKKISRFFKDENASGITHLPWRDTHIAVKGPVVADFEKIYRQKWLEQDGDPAALPARDNVPGRAGRTEVQAVEGRPADDRFSIYISLITAINLARHSIHLTTGYFVPTPGLIDALENAARRGADVTLLLPSVSDSDTALEAGHGNYEDLLEAGVKIYELEGSVLHAKTAVIDGIWSTVGSSNLDWRSAAINDECNAVILGPVFGRQMETMFSDDLAHSKQITREGWDKRPMGERIDEWKAGLVDWFL